MKAAGNPSFGARSQNCGRDQTVLKKPCRIFLFFLMIGAAAAAFGVESGQFRLLSVSDSTKMILVSQIPTKTKYILDAATAKITVDGKPSEFQNLDFYTIINVKFELKKGTKEGIEINGVATEIRIVTQENKK